MNFNYLFLKSKIALFSAVCLFATSCSTNPPKEGGDELAEDSTKTNSNGVLNVSGQLFSIPSPVQTAMLIQKAGAEYDKGILNVTASSTKYSTSFSKALNLGIYGADLGYVTMYNKTQDALGYLATVKRLADDLGVSGAFDQETMTRIQNNVTVKDSMLVLVGIAYRASDQYLKSENKNDISGLILTGGWLESLHFAIQVNKTKENEEIKNRIAQQKQSLGSLIKLLTSYETMPEYGSLVAQLKDLQKIYDTIDFKYIYEKPETDPIHRTTILNNRTEVKVSKEQINKISAKIQQIRDKIINPIKS